MKKLLSFIIFSILTFSLVACNSTPNQENLISEDKANTIAMERADTPNGEITKSTLDLDDNRKVYEIEIVDKVLNLKFEIEVDAVSGDILSFEKDTNNDFALPNDNTNVQSNSENITSEAAQEIALKETGGGEVIKVEFDSSDNSYEFEIINNNVEHEVEIDATSGNIIKLDNEIYNH